MNSLESAFCSILYKSTEKKCTNTLKIRIFCSIILLKTLYQSNMRKRTIKNSVRNNLRFMVN